MPRGRPRLDPRSRAIRVTVRIPPADRSRLLAAAELRGVSLSELVREALSAYLAGA